MRATLFVSSDSGVIEDSNGREVVVAINPTNIFDVSSIPTKMSLTFFADLYEPSYIEKSQIAIKLKDSSDKVIAEYSYEIDISQEKINGLHIRYQFDEIEFFESWRVLRLPILQGKRTRADIFYHRKDF